MEGDGATHSRIDAIPDAIIPGTFRQTNILGVVFCKHAELGAVMVGTYRSDRHARKHSNGIRQAQPHILQSTNRNHVLQ